jgi:CDP-diacylglycerol--glycerol-3-phosphate 3-phosphatidyltransferase
VGEPKELEFANAPNLLTLSRILAVPVVVWLLFQQRFDFDVAAAIIFGIASATDYFDGYLARRNQSVTVYGQLMDPLADKILVISSVIMLQWMGRLHPVVCMLLISREMAITGLRAVASAEGVVIAASRSAKWKTAFQMTAIPFMMVDPGVLGIPLFKIGEVLMYLSLGISLWSAQDYVVDFFKGLRESRIQRRREKQIAREARIASRNARMKAKHGRLTNSNSPQG